MKMLVIGAGMYVTGRGNTGAGTILAALAETSKTVPLEKVVVAARRSSGGKDVREASVRINRLLGARLSIEYRALGQKPLQQLRVLCSKEVFNAAIVAVPDHLHFIYTRFLLKNGIHCLVVKPLTPTVKEAKELICVQHKNNVHAAVEFHKRWDATNLYAKKVVSEGRLGKLLYVTVDYSQRADIPTKVFKEWAGKTNIFQYLGVHYVDLIYFLTGFIPRKAMAVGTKGRLMAGKINTFDSIHAVIVWQDPLNFKNELVTQFAVNWIDPDCTSALSDQKFKIIGTKGRLECDQKNRGVELVLENTGVQEINPYFAEYLPDVKGKLGFGGYGYQSIRQFVDDVQDVESKRVMAKDLELLRPTLTQSLVSTAVVEAVNRSLAERSEWKEIRG